MPKPHPKRAKRKNTLQKNAGLRAKNTADAKNKFLYRLFSLFSAVRRGISLLKRLTAKLLLNLITVSFTVDIRKIPFNFRGAFH